MDIDEDIIIAAALLFAAWCVWKAEPPRVAASFSAGVALNDGEAAGTAGAAATAARCGCAC